MTHLEQAIAETRLLIALAPNVPSYRDQLEQLVAQQPPEQLTLGLTQDQWSRVIKHAAGRHE